MQLKTLVALYLAAVASAQVSLPSFAASDLAVLATAVPGGAAVLTNPAALATLVSNINATPSASWITALPSNLHSEIVSFASAAAAAGSSAAGSITSAIGSATSAAASGASSVASGASSAASGASASLSSVVSSASAVLSSASKAASSAAGSASGSASGAASSASSKAGAAMPTGAVGAAGMVAAGFMGVLAALVE